MRVVHTAVIVLCLAAFAADAAGKAELPERVCRLVPQEGAAMAVVAGEPRYVSIWDYSISPSGELLLHGLPPRPRLPVRPQEGDCRLMRIREHTALSR